MAIDPAILRQAAPTITTPPAPAPTDTPPAADTPRLDAERVLRDLQSVVGADVAKQVLSTVEAGLVELLATHRAATVVDTAAAVERIVNANQAALEERLAQHSDELKADAQALVKSSVGAGHVTQRTRLILVGAVVLAAVVFVLAVLFFALTGNLWARAHIETALSVAVGAVLLISRSILEA